MKKLEIPNKRSKKKIWIDLDNSPHVPFFVPIIKELEKKDIKITVTARDCFQVCGLADLHRMKYRRIGRHYGKNKAMKVIGTLLRAFQLIPVALKEKPILSVSHGSRSQLVSSYMMKVPTMMLFDYEYTQDLGFIFPKWVMGPEVLGEDDFKTHGSKMFKYPGLKEDVYISDHKINPKVLEELNISKKEIVVTIRPPATEAHYHNPESEVLFSEVIDCFSAIENVRMVILPRNEIKQTAWIENRWKGLCEKGKIVIPKKVVNGIDLIGVSDLVVSGGGTMNREAAALGVPVYSIFRGKIGAVDKYLSDEGRLTLLETVEDVRTKIRLERREKGMGVPKKDRGALDSIVNRIIEILETR